METPDLVMPEILEAWIPIIPETIKLINYKLDYLAIQEKSSICNYHDKKFLVFEFLDMFDSDLQAFYSYFESKILNIRDLSDNKWLPEPESTARYYNRDEPEENIKFSKEKEEENKNILDFNTNFIKNRKPNLEKFITKMKKNEKLIISYLSDDSSFLNLKLKNAITYYMMVTLIYCNNLVGNWNMPEYLEKRKKVAFAIIEILKKEKKVYKKYNFNEPSCDAFIKKWEEYS